jgi:hypothetical protein
MNEKPVNTFNTFSSCMQISKKSDTRLMETITNNDAGGIS